MLKKETKNIFKKRLTKGIKISQKSKKKINCKNMIVKKKKETKSIHHFFHRLLPPWNIEK